MDGNLHSEWLKASEIDEFVIFLSARNSIKDDRYQFINEFGRNFGLNCIYEIHEILIT